jgi:tripeptide aminopeptidase
MQELGFKDASIDSEGNVIALRRVAAGGHPKLAVAPISTPFSRKASM